MAENPDTGQATGDGEQGDKRTVPLAALESETHRRQAAELEAAELRGRLDAAAAQPAPVETPKTFSDAELNMAVREGQMTETEASQIRENQRDTQISTQIAKSVTEAVSTQAAITEINSEIGRYKTAVPDIMDKVSESNQKLTKAFNDLVALGQPNSQSTELAAARQVFGSIDALESVGRVHDRETHQETGGGMPPASGGGSPDGKPEGMSADEDRHYSDAIQKGIYKGWAEVAEELKFANPNLRKKHGATIV